MKRIIAAILCAVVCSSALAALPDINAQAEPSAAPEPVKHSPRELVGYGVMNMMLGLGSFVQGDIGGGIMTLLLYGAAGGCIYWDVSLPHNDKLAWLPGVVGLGAIGSALSFGFIRPFVFNHNPNGLFKYGAMNMLLGLGSFVQGDISGGIMTLLLYGATAGLFYWELSLPHYDKFAGIPGAWGLGAAGFAVLYGFVRPLAFNNNQSLARLLDGIGLAIAPTQQGNTAIRLSYTLKL